MRQPHLFLEPKSNLDSGTVALFVRLGAFKKNTRYVSNAGYLLLMVVETFKGCILTECKCHVKREGGAANQPNIEIYLGSWSQLVIAALSVDQLRLC